MKTQTPSKKDEEEQAEIAEKKKAYRLLRRSRMMRQVEKEAKLIKRLSAKTQRQRVYKPKPKRRPINRVTILSIGGVPVEGVEDAFTKLS